MKFSAEILGYGDLLWEDGEISGDEKAVELLEEFADDMAGTPIGPPAGETLQANYLDDPYCTKQLIVMLFGSLVEEIEDIEGIPELPEEVLGEGPEE